MLQWLEANADWAILCSDQDLVEFLDYLEYAGLEWDYISSKPMTGGMLDYPCMIRVIQGYGGKLIGWCNIEVSDILNFAKVVKPSPSYKYNAIFYDISGDPPLNVSTNSVLISDLLKEIEGTDFENKVHKVVVCEDGKTVCTYYFYNSETWMVS